MKNLELTQMENLSAGDGLFTGASCGLAVFASAAVLGLGTIATAGALGPAAVLGTAYVSGAVCGGSIGYGLASGNWW